MTRSRFGSQDFFRTLPQDTIPSRVSNRLFAGLAGLVWGLALARFLAERYPNSPTYDLGPTLLVSGCAAALVGWGGWLVQRRLVLRQKMPTSGAVFAPLLLTTIYLLWPVFAPFVGLSFLTATLALVVLMIVWRVDRPGRPETAPVIQWFPPVFLACVVLLVYLLTLGPTVGRADTFEFQVVAPTLGIAHPTGYPLYVLSGKFLSLLPYGSVAWRVNLTSAVFGVATVVAVYGLIAYLTQRWLAAFVAALSLAVSRVFWSQAVVAEVYTLHNLFVATILLLVFTWVGGRRGGFAFPKGLAKWSTEGPGVLGLRSPVAGVYAVALLLGLSFAHHLTTVLLLPALALALLLARPLLTWQQWLRAGGLFVLGVSVYLYIFFRWPALHNGTWMSLKEFWAYITGQQFSGALRLDAWRTDPTRYGIVARLMREPFGWVGLAVGGVGLVGLVLQRWRVGLLTLSVFIPVVWYGLVYYVPDVEVFLLPGHLVLTVWLGAGVAVVWKAVDQFLKRVMGQERMGPWSTVGILCALALLPMVSFWTNMPLADQSDDREAYIWGERVLELPLAPRAAILADSARVAPLFYLQKVEGRRTDLDIVVLADEQTYRAELEQRISKGQTVYLARFLPGLEGSYHLRSLGPLTEVGTTPLTEAPPLEREVGIGFGPAPDQQTSVDGKATIHLAGFRGPEPGPDGGLGLTLYWRSDARVGEPYHVRLRLRDVAGQVWWTNQGRHPANNYYPTVAWRVGEVVPDYHEIPFTVPEKSIDPAVYTLEVGLFRPFSDEGLTTRNGETWYPLTQLSYSALAKRSTPRHPLRARFSGTARAGADLQNDVRLALEGVDLPDTVTVGKPVDVRLYPSGGDFGTLRAAADAADAGVQAYLDLAWLGHETGDFRAQILESWSWSRLLIQTPPTPGVYDLSLAMLDPQGRAMSARCGWVARPAEECVLATLRFNKGKPTTIANFDNKMLLLDARLYPSADRDGSPAVLSPGQALTVELTWQGLGRLDKDYTISVQLVGPDGRLHGQTDAWPVQGTLPTSHWSPGKTIVDPYHVVLAPDAPLGRYRVGIVVYLLETQMRLPILDDAGRAVGDSAWVAELEVVQPD